MKETDNLNGVEESSASVHDTASATTDEIRKAKELLRANGYWLVGYREAGEKVKRVVGSGLDFIKEKGNAFCGWVSAKRNELKIRKEDRSRAAAERRRLAEEAEELRVEAETALGGVVSDSHAADPGDVSKCAACGADLVSGARFCRKCGTRVFAVHDVPASGPPAEAKSESVAVEDFAVSGSGAQKCAVCGTAIAVGMKFCGECGTPVHAEARKPRRRKTARSLKTSRSDME